MKNVSLPLSTQKLHLGCGLNTPDGWINCDASWGARLAQRKIFRWVLKTARLLPKKHLEVPWSRNIQIVDVREKLPFQTASFRAVYASHLLEHLYFEEAKVLLRECYRVLMPDGALRIVVPDVYSITTEYLNAKEKGQSHDFELDTAPCMRLNERIGSHKVAPPKGSVIYRIFSKLENFQSHKWMYDAALLTKCFVSAGFLEAGQMDFNQSRIPEIAQIEQAGRILDGEGICVEGVKPNGPHADVQLRDAE